MLQDLVYSERMIPNETQIAEIPPGQDAAPSLGTHLGEPLSPQPEQPNQIATAPAIQDHREVQNQSQPSLDTRYEPTAPQAEGLTATETVSPIELERQQDLLQKLNQDVTTGASDDQIERDLRAYQTNSGDLYKLRENSPDPKVATQIDKLLDERLNKIHTKEEFFTEIVRAPLTETQILEDMKNYQQTFKEFGADLLSPQQIEELAKTNPDAKVAYDKAAQELLKETTIQFNDRQVEFATKLIAEHPEASEELKATAQQYGLSVLKDSLANIDPTNTQALEKVTQQAQQLGIENFDPAQLTAQVIPVLAEKGETSIKPDEQGFDALYFLGLKDENGEIKKGKTLAFMTALIAFMLVDQTIANILGSKSLVSNIFETVDEVERQWFLYKMHLDPKASSYHGAMGYGHNPKIMEWLLGHDKATHAEKTQTSQPAQATT